MYDEEKATNLLIDIFANLIKKNKVRPTSNRFGDWKFKINTVIEPGTSSVLSAVFRNLLLLKVYN